MMAEILSRRFVLAGAAGFAALALAGCSSTLGRRRLDFPDLGGMLPPQLNPQAMSMYAALPAEKFPVPAVDLRQLNPDYARARVVDPTGEKPGTIVVETSTRYLYLVQGDGSAIRYGIGVGRDGFRWAGRAKVGRKAEWPTWTPTRAMMDRQPETRQWAGGMPGGLQNPLGARALYIHQGGRDTLYRLHGTPEIWSIGKAVSSGCVRMINQDVIDLYQRCPVGTDIVVRS
jgi:lipoprotein-anchoring transpeptidase ErfK/SrfK